VVQDRFGGELLKPQVGDAWHFYNRIDGVVYDFTQEQFDEPPHYLDLLATREEALGDCTEAQYQALLERFAPIWSGAVSNDS